MVDTTRPGIYLSIYPGVDTMHCGNAATNKGESSPSLLEGTRKRAVVDTIPRAVDTWVDTYEESIYHRAPRLDGARVLVVDTGRYLQQYYACRGWWSGGRGLRLTEETGVLSGGSTSIYH